MYTNPVHRRLSAVEIDVLRGVIGMESEDTKKKTYNAYRTSKSFKELQQVYQVLCCKQFLKKEFKDDWIICKITKDGIMFLEDVFRIKIKHDL